MKHAQGWKTHAKGPVMRRCFGVLAISGVVLLGADRAAGQDTPAAKATRDRLKKITIEDAGYKDEMLRVILADLKSESDNKISFHVDTTTGMSMNSRMSFKGKNVPVEQILNELADKNDFGWFVMADKKSRYDGWVVLRKAKAKERGYEAGKEPKEKKSSLENGPREVILLATLLLGGLSGPNAIVSQFLQNPREAALRAAEKARLQRLAFSYYLSNYGHVTHVTQQKLPRDP